MEALKHESNAPAKHRSIARTECGHRDAIEQVLAGGRPFQPPYNAQASRFPGTTRAGQHREGASLHGDADGPQSCDRGVVPAVDLGQLPQLDLEFGIAHQSL
jgi:hypothetical protein